jgi:hypothetical protein
VLRRRHLPADRLVNRGVELGSFGLQRVHPASLEDLGEFLVDCRQSLMRATGSGRQTLSRWPLVGEHSWSPDAFTESCTEIVPLPVVWER